jgi:wyosine [tRNA(Phe)-imidazoG37] synthetase (radical SAM superfamily)
LRKSAFFIISNINDTKKEIQLIKNAVKKIKPNKIQLNTLDRPGTENWVKPVSSQKLKEFARSLETKSEIITKFKGDQDNVKKIRKNLKSNILETLKRRPCTDKDLAQIIGVHINEINKIIGNLLSNNKINVKNEKRGHFYYIK